MTEQSVVCCREINYKVFFCYVISERDQMVWSCLPPTCFYCLCTYLFLVSSFFIFSMKSIK